jgi:DNA sulfur modification protein DndD
MRINLAGWVSEGMRCPDVTIDLTGRDGGPAKIALIQMPNGTGKTTTLELLKATLTGNAGAWSEEDVRTYRRPGETTESGSFRVNLLVDDRPLTIELRLDFDGGTVAYRTTTPGSGGVKGGWNPPPNVRKFLSEAFLDLFIFDGEFADDLLKTSAGRADEAIDALCQLYLLDDVARVIDDKWKQKTSQNLPKSASGLSKFYEQRDSLVARRAQLVAAREKAERVIDDGVVVIADLKKKIADRLSSVEETKTQHNEARLALQAATGSVDRASADVMSALRSPIALHPMFGEKLVELRDNLDHLKLPETSSAQFFADLVLEPDCICGRPMNPVAKAEILKRAKGYMDKDESGTINALKHDIGKFTARNDETTPYEEMQSNLKQLTAARRAQREADQILRALAKKLIDAGDDELKEWEKARDEKEAQVAQCRDVIIDIDSTTEDDLGGPISSLKLLDKKLEDLKQKIAEVTKTVKVKKQTDLLNKILSETADAARARIRTDLVNDSNRRLEVVLANDPIRIARIDKSLYLAGQTGASVGQKLSVGYTFLMSALNRGGNDFPLIVDSPANPIDEGVRRNIGKLIPELCTQFVAFTINTERAGFVQALERSSDDCLFLTMFRKTDGTRRLMRNLPSAGVVETTNAVMVRDRDYFMSFDLATEEDF